MALGKPDATKLSVSRTRHRILCKSNVVNMLIHIHLAELWIQPSKKGDTEIAKRRHEDLKMPYFQRVWRLVNTVQVLFPAPPKDVNFDTKPTFLFLLVLMPKSCKYALPLPHIAPVSATFTRASAKSPFFSPSLHLTKVRIFTSPGLKIPFSPAKMHPTRDDY